MWVVVSVLLVNWSTWSRNVGNQLPSYTAPHSEEARAQLHRCEGLETRTFGLHLRMKVGQVYLMSHCILYSDHRHN